MADANDDIDLNGVVNLVDDAIIADTDTIGVFFAADLLDAVWSRIVRQCFRPRNDERANRLREFADAPICSR
jgi:hypothetical protein